MSFVLVPQTPSPCVTHTAARAPGSLHNTRVVHLAFPQSSLDCSPSLPSVYFLLRPLPVTSSPGLYWPERTVPSGRRPGLGWPCPSGSPGAPACRPALPQQSRLPRKKAKGSREPARDAALSFLLTDSNGDRKQSGGPHEEAGKGGLSGGKAHSCSQLLK